MTQAHVFAGIDHSHLNQSVTDYAAWIASTVDAPLTLLHNIEHVIPAATSDLSGSIGLGSREHLLEELAEIEAQRSRLLVEQGKQLLSAAEQRATHHGAVNCHKLQRHGALAESLVDLEDQIRVLVLGARGEDHAENSTALGHQIEATIRALHKPVLVVNRPFSQPKKLLLAYDGSEASVKALNWLATSPLYQNMECHLVHVSTNHDKGQALLEHAVATLKAAGIDGQSQVLSGNTHKELLEYQSAHDIDLVVMGSFGHSKLREMLLGSVTLNMLQQTKTPLLLLR